MPYSSLSCPVLPSVSLAGLDGTKQDNKAKYRTERSKKGQNERKQSKAEQKVPIQKVPNNFCPKKILHNGEIYFGS